jgi:type III pantothenate kinase
MLTLLIDVGNSAIKWALLRDGALYGAQWRLHRHEIDIAARLVEDWSEVPRGIDVVACNVAGEEVAAAAKQAVSGAQLGQMYWMQTQRAFAGPVCLINGYRDPLQLGADRWHCMLGACFTASQGVRGLVVVNAGTATTVDCIEATGTRAEHVRFAGRFVGGVIAPGVRLMLESLKAGTAGLPAATGVAAAFPDNTDAAIITGVLDAQAGLVQQIWHRFADRLSEAPQLILTGGNAATLAPRLPIGSAAIEDNLVLRGLALRAESALSK